MQNEQIQWVVDSLLSANANRAAAIIKMFGEVYSPEQQEELIATILRQVHSA